MRKDRMRRSSTRKCLVRHGGDGQRRRMEIMSMSDKFMKAAKPKPKAKNGNVDEEGKSTKAAKAKEPTVSIIQLYSFADRHDHVLMLIGTIGAVGHGLTLPVLFLYMGKIMNGIGSNGTYNKYVLGYLWMSILALGSSWLEVAFWMHTGQRQTAKLRAKYLQALLHQDVAYFDIDTTTGDIVNNISTDPNAVQDAIGEKTGHFLHYVTTAVAGITLAFHSEWHIALVTLAVLPFIALAGGLGAYYVTGITTKVSTAYSEAGSIAHQAISQIRIIYSFVAEEKFVKSYSEALKKPRELGIKGGLVKGIGTGATFFALFCSYALLVEYGRSVIRHGIANGGTVVASILNIVIGSLSLGLALSNLTPFTTARVSAFKILQVINHEPSINKPDESAATPKVVDGHIELRNVDFSYPSRPDVPIFQNFSLIIPPGKTVAIVGSSGSGKSTVVSLIERFYDPTAGEVLLDGVDLKKLDLKWLRGQIGLVNQEPALFGTTIAANLAYGRENASQEEIEEAAKVTNAHSFISQLPNGYQTEVGERGVQLSGGQRQRIAITRAVVKSPRILLLDEATSALDAGSEQVVQEALDRIIAGRTTVVVAHRLSTIRNADKIAVVEQGRIVESGTHQDLISKPEGAYSTLVLLQEVPTPLNNVERSPSNSPGRLLPGSPSQGLPDSSASLNVPARETHQPQQDEILQKSAPLKPIQGPVKRLIAMIKVKYGVAALIASVALGPVLPAYALFLAYVLADYYNPNRAFMKRNVAMFAYLYVALGVYALFMNSLQQYFLGVVGETLINRLREKLLAKVLRNELGWFDEAENNSSRLTARLASDIVGVKTGLVDTGFTLVTIATVFLFAIPICLVASWRLSLVMNFASVPLIVGAIVFENLLLKSFMADQAKAYQQASQVAGEAVDKIRTVVAFSAEDKVQALFANELQGPQKQSFRKGHIAGFLYGISQFFLYASLGLSWWYGGRLVTSGQATFADVIKVFFIFVVCSYGAADAFTVAPDIAKGGEAIKSLFQIIDRVPKIEPDDAKGEKVEKIEGNIELRQVTLVYPSRPDVIVLRKMSLKIKSGHSLALVGASGSGKSSIISLIERFYDPSSGEILIDGMDIKRYNLQSLRQHIALVQQEPALFATTIYENILHGKAGASEAEVVEAAKAANAHNFISSLPEGYNTLVGDRGVQLSSGQKQRVAIARAVIKDPIIFLLDEATSALDTESEKVVQEAIDRVMRGRTTILVAHRLSTIRGADSIAVVENGTIIEEGSHNALVNQGGAYSHLVRLQHHAQS